MVFVSRKQKQNAAPAVMNQPPITLSTPVIRNTADSLLHALSASEVPLRLLRENEGKHHHHASQNQIDGRCLCAVHQTLHHERMCIAIAIGHKVLITNIARRHRKTTIPRKIVFIVQDMLRVLQRELLLPSAKC